MLKNDSLTAAAFVLSLLAIVFSVANFKFSPSTDTFVGIMAGFMGACATIIVGYQIYSSIQHNRKFKEVERLISELKLELDKAKTGNMISEYIAISASASSFSEKQQFTSFYTYILALEKALILENTDFINKTLHNLKATRIKINNIDFSKSFSKSHIEKLKSQETASLLESYKMFDLIKDEYYSIYNDVKSRIEQINKNEK